MTPLLPYGDAMGRIRAEGLEGVPAPRGTTTGVAGAPPVAEEKLSAPIGVWVAAGSKARYRHDDVDETGVGQEKGQAVNEYWVVRALGDGDGGGVRVCRMKLRKVLRFLISLHRTVGPSQQAKCS